MHSALTDDAVIEPFKGEKDETCMARCSNNLRGWVPRDTEWH